MNEKRCKTCKYWKDDELEHMGRLYPICESQAFVDDFHFIGTTIAPKSICVCRHWQRCEPDLREELAKYAYYFVREGVKPYFQISDSSKKAYLGHSDAIIAIFEKYQKGKSDE